jgi:hypothetical protein
MLDTMCKMAMAFGVAVTIGVAAVADERHPLVGNWKLVSWQVIGRTGRLEMRSAERRADTW